MPLGVKLARLLGVLGRMQVMAMREMRLVRRLLVVLLAMLLCSLAMMLGRRLVVHRGP
jgi:hypothetical protein